MGKHNRTDFDVARDELMSHIHRCGVLKASPEQQGEWLDDTMQFMAERFTDLNEEQLAELHEIGKRFCQPVIAYSGSDPSSEAETEVELDGNGGAEQDEMAGAA